MACEVVLLFLCCCMAIYPVCAACWPAPFCRTLRFMYTTVNAAVSLHNRLLQHILRLPKAFFDTNPAGAL